jgi:hypothetical protein
MLTPRRPIHQPPDGVAGGAPYRPGDVPATRPGARPGASDPGRPGRGAAYRDSDFDFGLPLPATEGYDSEQYDDEYDDYDYGPTRRERFRGWSAGLLRRLAWIGLVAVLALGSAGMVAATSHSPALGERPELTWGADHALTVKLDAAVRELVLLSDDVTELGTQTRSVLSNLTQVNQVGVTAAQGDGTTALASIDKRTADLQQRLDCGPWTDAKITGLIQTYSPDAITRYRNVCLALDSVKPLDDDWASLVSGSTETMTVAQDIADHDNLGKDALELATAGRYPDALAKLADADKPLTEAIATASKLSLVADLSTLTTWLARAKAFDDALRILWQSLIDSKGRVTSQVTAALKAVNDAKALLPTNNSALQVSLFELTSRLTADGISIETARGQLTSAVALSGGTVTGP